MSAKVLRQKLEELFKLREEKRGYEKSLAEIKSNFSNLESEIIELMVDADIARMDIPGMGAFTCGGKDHPRCIDNDMLRSKLIEEGNESLLTLNHNTLRGWWKNDLTDEQKKHPEKYGIAVFRQNRIYISSK